MPWNVFEQQASRYEGWYTTARGQRVDQAERVLLERLLKLFPAARSLLEVGCGTGHFTAWLAEKYPQVVGLDRAPTMLAELQRRGQELQAIQGDAHHLPLCGGAVDVVLFVTTLEFLEGPQVALSEAVRVARQRIVLMVLNRWSLGVFPGDGAPRLIGLCLARREIRLFVEIPACAGEERYRETITRVALGEYPLSCRILAVPDPGRNGGCDWRGRDISHIPVSGAKVVVLRTCERGLGGVPTLSANCGRPY